ncbi:hypothetical protein EHQ12_17875 [Leptospira gomenensis]|uniref:Ankyrin repeat domain-containing protein n=2 Tax=Leptospira gomenensis TaxID=2484974 RepID=A0A5F1YD34_9LEPT|nr:hypothetical protein [Leptospira gomenensis]TGK33207.1 hypothetical protein EHQ12_17875 [Leptospira gomenensis]TGK35560.1 hypothetical protein EHQ17_06450 [Leptospira gomenensis]TGK40884.1 hypothetical protein EHQ07_17410 [Leptospira gomenensis]TGK61174.1 hypothetical protein EHQ13_09945 [Leptospira gomenensis]
MKYFVPLYSSNDPNDPASSGVWSAWELDRSVFRKGDFQFDLVRRGERFELRRKNILPVCLKEIDAGGYALLILAANHGHCETVRCLISLGDDVIQRIQTETRS